MTLISKLNHLIVQQTNSEERLLRALLKKHPVLYLTCQYQLWCTHSGIKRLGIAYNNAYQILQYIPRKKVFTHIKLPISSGDLMPS